MTGLGIKSLRHYRPMLDVKHINQHAGHQAAASAGQNCCVRFDNQAIRHTTAGTRRKRFAVMTSAANQVAKMK